ncbi:Zinc finger MYM-type protein 1 [Aphis craccivora]|uniref:Zinc finger MYM-type protein 1 n=1 Tax=Aphis craccivora TaxID=307492 RepID=A0A6G0YPA6_APHCR|nr:Zinc finger MYM-type protein 1 [Aphis craccivora]
MMYQLEVLSILIIRFIGIHRLRNSLSQEKLETFLLMNVEKDILATVRNEDVIQLITEKSDLLKKKFDWLNLILCLSVVCILAIY